MTEAEWDGTDAVDAMLDFADRALALGVGAESASRTPEDPAEAGFPPKNPAARRSSCRRAIITWRMTCLTAACEVFH